MKKQLLQIASLLLAIHFLFLSLDVNVNIHYCSEDHLATTSFGDASKLCHHCHDHHHQGPHEAETSLDTAEKPLHYAEKCCCDDFNNEIHLSELTSPNYDNPTPSVLTVTILNQPPQYNAPSCNPIPHELLHPPHLLFLWTGRLKTIFFSQLKLNPSVF